MNMTKEQELEYVMTMFAQGNATAQDVLDVMDSFTKEELEF